MQVIISSSSAGSLAPGGSSSRQRTLPVLTTPAGKAQPIQPLLIPQQNAAVEDSPQQQVAAAAQRTRRRTQQTGAGEAARSDTPKPSPQQQLENKPAWAAAVDRRVAALSRGDAAVRSARHTRISRHTLPALAHSQRPVSAHRRHNNSSSSMQPNSHPTLTASLEELLGDEGGEMSPEGEQQLCLAYQRYLQLQQLADSSSAADATSLAALLSHDPDRVQREGLLAQELLLQLYEPMLINRAKRVLGPTSDLRELLAVARQGLLRAAARYDIGRAGGGRLYALADRYISMELRDVVTEYQSAVVRVPQHVRLLCRKLRRVEQQLQQRQQGKPPSLEQVAAAAGVSAKLAQRALDTTGGALQAVSLQQSVSKGKEDKGKGSTAAGMGMQQVDVSLEEDSEELAGVVGAGGLAAARSGLHTELDAAAEKAAVETLLQGLMSTLSPDDQTILRFKLEGGNVSQMARQAGRSREWGRQTVNKVLQRLREDMRQHAQTDGEAAALLKLR